MAQAGLTSTEYEFLSLEEIASHPQVDTVVIATSGKSGLSPTLAAVRAGKNVALSNKESLVMAGEIITSEAKKNNARILPVDSEHSAIWQCLRGENQSVARIILTASGGPFRHYSPARLDKVTVGQALAHPSWQMGKKVTIDSATLMNKGLEIIEARWLFGAPVDSIRVLIHPQSIVHSMVELADGSVKAQLGEPDMRLPIQCALTYPDRAPVQHVPALDLAARGSLNFGAVDDTLFPALGLALEAGRREGTYAAALSGADAAAVGHFLAGRCRFTDIARLLGRALETHASVATPALEELIAADRWGREFVDEQVAAGVR